MPLCFSLTGKAISKSRPP